jgi:hypothetical protein
VLAVGVPVDIVWCEFRGVLTGVPMYQAARDASARQRGSVTVDESTRDRRLLFLAATAKDAATTESMLSPLGIRLDVCRTFEALLEEAKVGAAAILLPEEAASSAHNAALRAVLAAQPPWSTYRCSSSHVPALTPLNRAKRCGRSGT